MVIKVALGVVLGFALLFCAVTLIAAVSAGVMKIQDRINRKGNRYETKKTNKDI